MTFNDKIQNFFIYFIHSNVKFVQIQQLYNSVLLKIKRFKYQFVHYIYFSATVLSTCSFLQYCNSCCFFYCLQAPFLHFGVSHNIFANMYPFQYLKWNNFVDLNLNTCIIIREYVKHSLIFTIIYILVYCRYQKFPLGGSFKSSLMC